MTLNNLTAFYKSVEKYAEAESFYQRALAIFEACLGPAHLKVITCLRNYAQLLWATQRRAAAHAWLWNVSNLRETGRVVGWMSHGT